MNRSRVTCQERRDRAERAEEAVVRYLESLGFQMIARNLRLGRLEIDIVARDGRTIVVVEVRTRGPGALTTGFGSIDQSKRRHLRRAGERLWDQRYRNDPTVDHLRFDAASVTFVAGQPEVSYCRAAF